MRTLLLVAVLVVTSACPVVGDGTIVSNAREVGPFRSVRIESGLTALITASTRTVTVRTDENLQPLIETAVEGDRLIARLRPGVSSVSTRVLEITIGNDVVEGVSASGAADVSSVATPTINFVVEAAGGSTVRVSGVLATSISATASQGSTLTATGAATSGALVGSGASVLELKALPLTSASIDLKGSSSLRAAVSSTLTGSVSGSSTATITGTPSSDVSVTDASELTRGAP